MEVISLTGDGIRIKTKKTTLLVDPSANPDNEVVLFTSSTAHSGLLEKDVLAIHGAGEYEVQGVSIKGENVGDSVIYTLIADNEKILLFPSSAVKQIKDIEDFDAILIHAVEPLEEPTLSFFSAVTPIIFGESSLFPEGYAVKKLPKVNISKREEVEESAIYLAK